MYFDDNALDLFAHDARNGLVNCDFNNKQKFISYFLMQNVSRNATKYTAREISKAKAVRDLHKRIGSPFLRKFSK